MKKIFDVLVLGGGVAGMTAALYAKRSGKNVAIIEKFILGGQINLLERIENFPSQQNIDGFTLAQMFAEQVKFLDIEIFSDDILKVDFLNETKILYGKSRSYEAKSVVVATGMSYVQLGINENQYLGRGVSFCAICDGNFYKNQNVCVASKNGSGIKGAIELSKLCKKVTIFDSGDLSVYAKANPHKNIKIFSFSNVENILGEKDLEKIAVSISGQTKEIETNALFIELGRKPATLIFQNVLKMDEKGFIETDEKMNTSQKNIYAVGDVRAGFLKQIVTACSDGAIAGQFAGN